MLWEAKLTYETGGLRERERKAVAAFYDRYASWFRARLVHRYGAQEAEDLLQETWLRLAPYRDAAGIRHPKALLLRIAANLANDRHARRARSERFVEETARLDGWGIYQASQTDDVFVRQLVLGLPQPLRDVFVLSRFGGLTNSQIAERLGISPKTVEWRMTKALAHCAAQLRR